MKTIPELKALIEVENKYIQEREDNPPDHGEVPHTTDQMFSSMLTVHNTELKDAYWRRQLLHRQLEETQDRERAKD